MQPPTMSPQSTRPTLLVTTLSVALLGAVVSCDAAAQAVRCLDRSGSSHTLASPPPAAYSFFVRCEPMAEAAHFAAQAAARVKPPRNVSVTWPAPRTAAPVAAWRSLPPPRSEPVATLPARAESYLPVIRRVAADHGLDPYYLKAVMHTESAFDRNAISPKGAVGLMQLMPATAQRFGVSDPQQLRDPAINVETAARYLAHLRRLFDGDWTLITAAYNAGEGAVRRYGNAVPPFAETQDYVRLVDARLQQYSSRAAAR
jgi:soluble lytic murein transglycosylase-like protein